MAEMIEIGIDLLRAAVWPAAAALAILLAGRIALSMRATAPLASSQFPAWLYIAAFVVAYCLGHALAAGPDLTLRPVRNWHWMFYLVPMAGIAAAISSSPLAGWWQRCVLVALLAILAAGLLTQRPTLWAPRPLLILAIFSYVVFLWSTLEPLASRVAPGILAAAYALVAATTGAMIAEQANLTDGKIVMSAAGAFAAVALAAWRFASATPATGLSLPFAIAIGGWAWVEALFEARIWPLVLIPPAAAALWFAQFGPLKQSRPVKSVVVHLACVFVAVVVACGLLKVISE